MARNERFDTAIVDIDLPDVNGIDLVRSIKADTAHAELRIVMLTSRDQEIDEFGDMRAYVSANLSKMMTKITTEHLPAPPSSMSANRRAISSSTIKRADSRQYSGRSCACLGLERGESH